MSHCLKDPRGKIISVVALLLGPAAFERVEQRSGAADARGGGREAGVAEGRKFEGPRGELVAELGEPPLAVAWAAAAAQ